YYSSPGMVSESFSLFKASGLSKVSEGGGVDGENILVHRVAVAGLNEFIAKKRGEGAGIDVKLLLLLQAETL
ncbi:MAG: NUDIX hydrolase, partial [Parasphingorhabdus sp.]